MKYVYVLACALLGIAIFINIITITAVLELTNDDFQAESVERISEHVSDLEKDMTTLLNGVVTGQHNLATRIDHVANACSE
jgi:uncharacterized membrane protein SirB2